ncbi:MAG TPA: cytochrome d ubiquinol oxidase subunit II [Streptosporangiaceae bacterium]|jgi:cytochrome d ubiquinol oxidase subunit II|nr:cytochrome d ubiquinol oxidase subunit II [Streptosporangiaceae bacterium]
MTLAEIWFLIIALLWTGFFVLEGFDFGVGLLHALIGRDEPGRRATIATIGPLWDGNEVWLIVAGAAMFAAFPGWYATMFSGFYLALVLLLGALMARGTSFEFRGKRDSATWRATWSGLLMAGSLLAPLLIGVALGDLLHGLPVNGHQEFTGSFWTLLQPYGLATGITLVVLCVVHGATFIALKTSGDLRARAARLARRAAPVAALVLLAFVIWTHSIAGKGLLPNPVEIAAVLAMLAGAWLVGNDQEGWGFATTTVAIALVVLSIFSELYPRVMVSSTRPAFDLTIQNTASAGYSLRVMTVVVLILLPVVLAYTAWTYYVFRRRLSDKDFGVPALSRKEQS